jgi:sugar phosphate isomerase/epimerase
MSAAVGANHVGDKETLPGGGLELLQKLKGKIAHVHLIDSDGTLNAQNTSTRTPIGQGVVNFDLIIPELLTCGVADDWWCVDLCFQPDAWTLTAESKRFLDKLRHKYAA